MKSRISQELSYVLIKIPFSKVPRFIPLPKKDGMYYYMFVDDVIRAGLPSIFPGYEIEGCYSIKISRDADIYIDDANSSDSKDVVSEIKKKIGKRKIGALSRFMYDRAMPQEMLDYVCDAFGIASDDLVVGGRYMNLQDLIQLPNPTGSLLMRETPAPMKVQELDEAGSMFKAVLRHDVLLYFPYQSFDYLLRFFFEASYDADTEEIKITQYRVAENSAIINTLINAARNGKKVTVFVELKARFDEENNIGTAELMEQAGIKIVYSMPGLKVHSKMAVILRKDGVRSFACLSTGNFNEKTAKIYSDMALLTCDERLVDEANMLFAGLERRNVEYGFKHLLVAPINMTSHLHYMLEREEAHVRQGKRGYAILKMNGLHDKNMIDALYHTSESGVEIDLIVRGICCLVPDQSFSRNIHITRIVDMFLEHSRVWYFYNDGAEDVWLASADWMRRNLSRRIETAFPIIDPKLKQEVKEILKIQLRDNVQACSIDENLNNIRKRNDLPPIRAQEEIPLIITHNSSLI